MSHRTRAAVWLLAFAPFASATNPAVEQARYQRQYQYAQIMMRLNGIGGALSAAELAKLTVSRASSTPGTDQESVRDFTMDAFADAVEGTIGTARAKRALSRQWQIDEDYPSHWSISSNPEAAADCSRAIEHELGLPLRVEMHRDGVAWLRVVAPSKGFWTFDTLISEFDTKLSVYRDCRDIAGPAKQESDDALGLGSIVGLDAKSAGQTFLLKLERRGGVGEMVIAKSKLGGSTISGRVTRARDGVAIQFVRITAFHAASGTSVSSDWNYSDGTYTLPVYADGSYHVRATPSESHYDDLVSEMHPSAVCASTDSFRKTFCEGVMVPVILAGSPAVDVDFALDDSAILIGTLRNELTEAPVVDALVKVFVADPNGEADTLRETRTDAAGRFRMKGLPERDWRAEFRATRFGTERWQDVQCAVGDQCPAGSGQPIPVHVSSPPANIQVAMTPMHYLRFRVTVPGIQPYAGVGVYNLNGELVASGSWPTPDESLVEVGPLPPGNYVARVGNNGAFDKVYGGPDCPRDCMAQLALGAQINVPATTGELAVTLKPWPNIAGRISSDTDGTGLANAYASVIGAPLQHGSVTHVASAQSDADGNYTIAHVPPGSYHLNFNAVGYIGELYENIQCEALWFADVECPGAQLLTIGLESPAQQTFNAALERAPTISGTIGSYGQLYNQANIRRMDLFGQFVSSDYIYLQNGHYSVTDLPAGTSLWGVFNAEHRPQLYSGVDCPNEAACDYQLATPVVLANGIHTSGIDFQLTAAGARRLRVFDNDTGAPLPGVAIDQWTLQGVWLRSTVTSADGWASLQPGPDALGATYVSTDASALYLNRVYENSECLPGTSSFAGTCSVFTGFPAPISQAEGAEYAPLVMRLRSAIRLFSSGFE